jgi:hypothetical protein
MTKMTKVNVKRKLGDAWKHDGVSGLIGRSAVYILRRVAWRSEVWSKILDDRIASRAILKENRALLERNARFRDCHQGTRCFVIGNGPSLNTQDLSFLADEITFVANGFWKHPVLDRWQPTYYVLSDPLYFDGSEPAREFYANLRARVNTSTFFVPHYAQDPIERDSLLPVDRTHFVAFSGDLEDGLRGIDLTHPLPGMGLVTQLAIMLAIYMRCSPIYLLGCDHDWLAHRGTFRDFYQGVDLPNHPKINYHMGAREYDLVMELGLKGWRGYRRLEALAELVGVKILNATEGGFLDVFERVRYESLFDSRRPAVSRQLAAI